ALRRHLDDVPVVRKLHVASFGEERGNVRREKVLALPETDDERCLPAEAGEDVGMIVMHRHDREVPLEVRVYTANRLEEIAFVLAFDQMRHDLGIGLRRERMA